MLRSTRLIAVAALGGVLTLAAGPAAFAQQPGANERDVAVGSDLGNIVVDDSVPAPDSPTTIAVGGDSNENVPQPNLSSVPSTSDGIFSAPTGLISPSLTTAPAPASIDPAPLAAPAPAESAPVEAAPAEAVPVEPAPVEAAPVAEAPAPGPACGYPSWYDAQLALEADASLAPMLDPDGDGIACEEAMYS